LLLPLFGLQKLRDKQTVKAVVGILLNQGGFNIGSKLFRLFLEFVDWNFSNKQTEIFSWCVHLSSIAMINRHGNVGLVSEFKFLLVAHIVNILVPFVIVLIYSSTVFIFGLLRADLSTENRVRQEKLLAIDSGDGVNWNVRGFVLKTAMDVDCSLDLPACGSETLNCLEFVPLAGLSVIDFHRDVFTYLICATSDDHHQRAQE
jgi:hypothetical protein